MAKRPRLFGDYQQRSAEAWQLALESAPLPVLDDHDQPFLPQVAVCLNTARGLAEMSAPSVAGSDEGTANAREALRRGAREWRVKPGKVLTEDAALAEALRAELAAEGVAIETRPELTEIRGLLTTLFETLEEPGHVPDLLSGEGVTLEQARAFANAAQQFFAHAPWRWLSDEDLIRVESPDLGEGLRHFVVMGAGGDQFGLLFFDSPEEWEEAFDADPEARLLQRGSWAVSFDEPAEALPAEVALWLRHELPKTGDGRIPVALFFHQDTPQRPDARTLAYFEGLLSAFAGVTEEQIDRGRFESAVLTHKGPATFVLSLPGLLKDQEIYEGLEAADDGDGPDEDDEPWDDEDEEGEPLDLSPDEIRAYEMLALATEAHGRRRIQLARKALAIDPGLADAYGFLASQAGRPEDALELYEKSRELAEARLDPAVFTQAEGQFGQLRKTFPYLRARMGIAESLRELDRPEVAAAQYEEILRLDAQDDPGNRYPLADLYFELDRMEALGALLDRFPEDRTATWSFARALRQFRLHGDAPASLRALRTACQSNPYVPVYLLGEKELPDDLPEVTAPGSELEAAAYTLESFDAWEETEDALDWLAAFAPPPPRPEAERRRNKKGKGGQGRASGSRRR